MKTPRKSANGDALGDPRMTPLPRLLGFAGKVGLIGMVFLILPGVR